MAKLLIDQKVPVYLYVLNTTIEAFNYPQWRRVPHDTEHYLLAGAPFMDVGQCFLTIFLLSSLSFLEHYF